MHRRSIFTIGSTIAAAAGIFIALPGTAAAATTSRSCAVDQIGVMENRIHIKCAPIEGVAHTQAIYYFAMPLSEGSVRIDNMIALAVAAKTAKRTMVIWWDVDDYASVPGCQGSNCRRLKAAALE